MGLAERMTERRLHRFKGSSHDENVRTVRRGNAMLLLATGLNGLAVPFGLLGNNGSLRTIWTALGVFWLLFTYLLVRQRLYLRRLAADE